jgi:MscS family membrane protein
MINRKTLLGLLHLLFISIFHHVIFAADPDLKTPSLTAYTHIYHLQQQHYDPQRAAKTMYGKQGDEAQKWAIQLKQVLDAKLLIIDTAQYPNDPNYRDSSGKHLFFPFPQNKDIYLQKIGTNWYYSPHTVSRIPTLYAEAIPFGSDLLISLFGTFGQHRLLGYFVWQWLGIGVLLFLIFAIYTIQWWVIDKLVVGLLFRRSVLSADGVRMIRSFARYGSMFLLLHYTQTVFPVLQFPIKVNVWVMNGMELTAVVFLILVLHALIDLIILRYNKIISASENTMGQQFQPVLKKLLQGLAIIFGAVLMLKTLGVNLGALLAGVSIAGLALALAAQDTVKNLFGSVMIFIDQPFKIGDWIRVDGIDGTVELVSLRATRVRTFENSLVYIPNGKLADAMVNNYGLRVYRRFNTPIAITYDTPPALIEAYIKGLRELVKNHPDTRKDYYLIYLNAFSDSALHILFYIFFKVPDWKEELRARHEIMLGAVALANELGIRFAFPTQTLHIENMPEKNSLTPQFNMSADEMEAKSEAFLSAYKAQYAKTKGKKGGK